MAQPCNTITGSIFYESSRKTISSLTLNRYAFSSGDLLMVSVLRRLNGIGSAGKYPNLAAYVARGEARPAYKRAFDDQLAGWAAI